MGLVRVSDVVIWISHIEGDDALRQKLLDLPSEAIIRLDVAGRPGLWKKMRDARGSGRPTPGLKPHDEIRRFWVDLYTRYKPDGGIVVGIVESEHTDASAGFRLPSEIPLEVRFDEPDRVRRTAALNDLALLRQSEFRSLDIPYGVRDDWYREDDR